MEQTVTYNEVAIIILCAATLTVAGVATWWVTRPFEQARSEARRRRKAAQTAGHAAE